MKKESKPFFLLILFIVSVSCEVSIGGHTWIRDPSLIFSPTELEDATVGQTYDVTITITNNDTPVHMIYGDESAFPPGLALFYEDLDSQAVLSGVPEKAGVYEFTISAHCLGTNKNGQYGKQHYRLVVKK